MSRSSTILPGACSLLFSIETDQSEESSPTVIVNTVKSSSSSASTEVLPKMQKEEDPEQPVLENGFHTP